MRLRGRFGAFIEMAFLKQRTLAPVLWLCVLSAFGDFSESVAFSLNTLSPSPVLSSVFTANTLFLINAQMSGNFLCSTIYTDQKISAVFTGDTLQKLYGSDVFLADTMTVPMDTNTNGLPNVWEMRYFGGTTAANASALAANGINTIYEMYVTGLNPTNPASLFVVQIIEDARRIKWASVKNRNYTVQHSPKLSEPFTNVTTGAGTGADMSYSSNPDSKQQGFYRVNVKLP
jgi:hypothetical protein